MAIERLLERRRSKRYPVHDGILVSTPSKTGEMLDISMGGLSFRYVNHKEMPEGYESAILFGEDELFLENIPLQMVGDYTQEPETGEPRKIRKIGACFGTLSKRQQEILRDFIQVHSL